MSRRRSHSKRGVKSQRKGVNQGVPLTGLLEGQTGKVLQVQGGRGACMRLAEMGFHPGAVVTMESKHSSRGGGPIAVLVKGTKLGLGRGIARKIIVKPLT